MPAALAWASPAASARLETTSTMAAGYAGARAASISATMLEPRPEISTATRFLAMCSPAAAGRGGPSSAMACPLLLRRFGTLESATVQWLDRGYTPTRGGKTRRGRTATAGRAAEPGRRFEHSESHYRWPHPVGAGRDLGHHGGRDAYCLYLVRRRRHQRRRRRLP